MKMTVRPVDVNAAIRCFLAPLPPEADKFANGRVLLIAGSRGMTGAAILAAGAAMRSGAGLVYTAIPGACLGAVETALTEAVKCPIGDGGKTAFGPEDAAELTSLAEHADAVVLGPGLGRQPGTQALVTALLDSEAFAAGAKMLVLDADGLYPYRANGGKLLAAARKRPGKLVITPHEGEAARLLGVEPRQIHENRAESARQLAALTGGGAAVLKGHGTLIAGGDAPETVYVNNTGNPGMGTGGSGDVLAGMIAALALSADNVLSAACCGTALHGLSGDIMAERFGQRFITASDLINGLGEIKNYAEQHKSLG